jgi:hypothetical protein
MYICVHGLGSPKQQARDLIGEVPGRISALWVRFQTGFLRSLAFIAQENKKLLRLSPLKIWYHLQENAYTSRELASLLNEANKYSLRLSNPSRLGTLPEALNFLNQCLPCF